MHVIGTLADGAVPQHRDVSGVQLASQKKYGTKAAGWRAGIAVPTVSMIIMMMEGLLKGHDFNTRAPKFDYDGEMQSIVSFRMSPIICISASQIRIRTYLGLLVFRSTYTRSLRLLGADVPNFLGMFKGSTEPLTLGLRHHQALFRHTVVPVGMKWVLDTCKGIGYLAYGTGISAISIAYLL